MIEPSVPTGTASQHEPKRDLTMGNIMATPQSPASQQTAELPSKMRWTGKVGPANLNSDYAIPFTVTATTRKEAIARAIEVGGYSPRNSQVWITGAVAVEEPTLTKALLAQIWRDGYYAAKGEPGSTIDNLPNPYEDSNRS